MTTYQEPIRRLDLLKRRGRAGGIQPVVLRRGEKGQQIQAYITKDDEAFPLTGYTAKFCAVNAKGELVKRSATVSNAASGLVAYAVTSDLTAWEGSVLVAYFELTKSGEIATSDTLPFIVLDNADIAEGEAAEYESSIDAMIEAAQAEAVAQATESVQAAYAIAEAARDALYRDAESARDDAYDAAEAARNVNSQNAPFSVVDGKLCITYYDGEL